MCSYLCSIGEFYFSLLLRFIDFRGIAYIKIEAPSFVSFHRWVHDQTLPRMVYYFIVILHDLPKYLIYIYYIKAVLCSSYYFVIISLAHSGIGESSVLARGNCSIKEQNICGKVAPCDSAHGKRAYRMDQWARSLNHGLFSRFRKQNRPMSHLLAALLPPTFILESHG